MQLLMTGLNAPLKLLPASVCAKLLASSSGETLASVRCLVDIK